MPITLHSTPTRVVEFRNSRESTRLNWGSNSRESVKHEISRWAHTGGGGFTTAVDDSYAATSPVPAVDDMVTEFQAIFKAEKPVDG